MTLYASLLGGQKTLLDVLREHVTNQGLVLTMTTEVATAEI